MQQRDLELVEGWMAAERGDPRDVYATSAWLEGYDLKCSQLAERFRYRSFACQPAAVQ